MLHSIKKNTTLRSYPFQLELEEGLDLLYPVIFFTGENGSGKSTLLKIIASITDSIVIARDSSKEDLFDFNDEYTLSWTTRLKKGMWFQSEDFLSYLKWAQEEEHVYKQYSDEVDLKHENKQTMEYLLEKGLQEYNKKTMGNIVTNMHEASHGEGTIEFFLSKLRANTLYLLDEPEAPLSFQNQLSLMLLLDEYVKQGSQFIICTHSPILLGYPNAVIYHFEDNQVSKIEYEDHPLVRDYRYYLENPKRYLRHLFKGDY